MVNLALRTSTTAFNYNNSLLFRLSSNNDYLPFFLTSTSPRYCLLHFHCPGLDQGRKRLARCILLLYRMARERSSPAR